MAIEQYAKNHLPLHHVIGYPCESILFTVLIALDRVPVYTSVASATHAVFSGVSIYTLNPPVGFPGNLNHDNLIHFRQVTKSN